MAYRPNDAPDCFGTWSASSVHCTGGLDPAYRHPLTGAHKRERCDFYSACAQNSNKPVAIPVQPVPVQPQSVPVQPPRQQTYPITPQWPYAGPPRVYQQPNQPPPPHPTPMAPYMVPPYVAQQGPQVVPMPYPQPGGQIPSYLSVPEPINPNEHWVKRLLREVARSMFKSTGHTTANFFDHNPFRPYPIPEEPQIPNAPDKKGP